MVEVKHDTAARKNYACKGCGHKIDAGTLYTRVKSFSPDGVSSYATHEECMWITTLFNELFGLENDEETVSSAKQIADNLGWRFYLQKCREYRNLCKDDMQLRCVEDFASRNVV